MKHILIALGIAAAAVGCENRNTANRTNADQRTTTTAQNDAQQQMNDAQQKMTEAQSEADKAKVDAQQNANEQKAEAAKDMRDAQANLGAPVTVTATVSDIDSDSFSLKTQDGKDLDFKLSDQKAPGNYSQLKEGDQVRASYTAHDGENYVQDLKVIKPAPVK